MKTDYTTSKVEQGGSFETSAFKFAESAKVFRILSDGLYSDKIGSIVREIICNAFDSHVQAGKPDVPVEIYLPTSIDPNFKVVDHGVGLSFEEIHDIYTTYGATTKDNSNEVIGAFGLGSKSPFSYSESFGLTAVKDGTKAFYTAYIDEDGYPKISRMMSEDTDEENGVIVTIPFKEQDFSELREKVIQFLSDAVSPATLNGVEVKRTVHDAIFSADKAKIIKSRSFRKSAHTVRMGDVLYRISIDELCSCFEDKERRDLFSRFINSMYYDSYNIAFEVGIGDIEVSSSRESIAFTKRTTEVIEKIAWGLVEEYRKTAEIAFEESQRKNKKWAAFIEGSAIISGKEMKFFSQEEIREYKQKLRYPALTWTPFASRNLGIYVFANGRRSANIMNSRSATSIRKEFGILVDADKDVKFITPSSRMKFFFETGNVKRNLGDLSEHFAYNNRGDYIVYIAPLKNISDDSAMHRRFIKRAKRELGLEPINIIDNVEINKDVPTTKKSTKTAGWKAQVYSKAYVRNYYGPSTFSHKAVKVDDYSFFDGKIVAPRNKEGRIEYIDGNVYLPRDLMDYIIEMFGKKTELVVLPPTVYKRIDEDGGLEGAMKLNETVWELYDDFLYEETVINEVALSKIGSESLDTVHSLIMIDAKTYEDEFLYKIDDRALVEAVGPMYTFSWSKWGKSKSHSIASSVLRFVGTKLSDCYWNVIQARIDEINALLKPYGLLRSLNLRNDDDIMENIDDIVEYMNFKYAKRSQSVSG